MTTALEGVRGQRHALAALYPREKAGTHCTGGWLGPRAGLNGRKISPQRDSIPGPSSPYSVAIPTELTCLNACVVPLIIDKSKPNLYNMTLTYIYADPL